MKLAAAAGACSSKGYNSDADTRAQLGEATGGEGTKGEVACFAAYHHNCSPSPSFKLEHRVTRTFVYSAYNPLSLATLMQMLLCRLCTLLYTLCYVWYAVHTMHAVHAVDAIHTVHAVHAVHANHAMHAVHAVQTQCCYACRRSCSRRMSADTH